MGAGAHMRLRPRRRLAMPAAAATAAATLAAVTATGQGGAAPASPAEPRLRGPLPLGLGLGPQLSSTELPASEVAAERGEASDGAGASACWDLYPIWGDGASCQAGDEGCSELGWDCAAYERLGWCSDGVLHRGASSAGDAASEAAFGAGVVCCACGGGKRRAPCDDFDSDIGRETRRALGRPEGYGTCAVVGSSGLLLHERAGRAIDAYDLVIRINLAPLQGFEEVVGSRTGARILATEAAGVLLLEHCDDGWQQGRNATVCPDYALLVNSWYPTRSAALRNTCPGNVVIDTHNVKHASVAQKLWPPDGNPFSGQIGVAFATLACRTVDVFGFTHAGNVRYSGQVPFHYYDERNVDGIDDLPKSAQLLSDFASGDGASCLRLDTPAKLLPAWHPASHEAALAPLHDPFVESVTRHYGRFTYRRQMSPDDPCSIQSDIQWYEHRAVCHVLNRLMGDFYYQALEEHHLLETLVGSPPLPALALVAAAAIAAAACCARRAREGRKEDARVPELETGVE